MSTQSGNAPTPQASASDSTLRQRRPILALCGIVLGGFAAASASAWLVVALMNLLADRSAAAQFDDRITSWLTVNGFDGADRVLGAIGLLGGWALLGVAAIIVVAFLVRRNTARAASIILAGSGAFALNSFLRLSFERAHSVSATTFTSAAQAWTFPSGHALNALVLYGMLACILLETIRSRNARVLIVAATAVLVLVIGFTRVYFGVHSFSEVATGYLAGTVWLCTCVSAYHHLAEILPHVTARERDDELSPASA